MLIKAHCKINIGLNILRRRADGYHDIETIMMPVRGLYDTIEVVATEDDAIMFRQSGIIVDCPMDKNLCVRAARLMQERYNIGGVSITLDKLVPFGAGLGGGSADATAVIVAINEIYALGLTKERLAALAAELGSDTPFFVYDEAMVCRGRGEVMTPIEVPLEGLWLAIVKPMKEGVSTAEAYGGVTPHIPERGLEELISMPIDRWRESIINDFEPHIFAAHPRIAEIKAMLYDAGAIYAAMSGSGSALFGLFKSCPTIERSDDTFVHIEKFNSL